MLKEKTKAPDFTLENQDGNLKHLTNTTVVLMKISQ